MGYQKKPKTLKLTFRGELEGLEVSVRHASPDMMRRVIDVAENAEQGSLAEQARRVLDLCDTFGALIHSWNYEDERGRPLPATAETLAAEDVSFVIALTYGWMDAVAERAEQMHPEPQPVAEADLPMDVDQPV